MSWSLSVPNVPAEPEDELEQKLRAAADAYFEGAPALATAEAIEQVDAAVRAAVAIAKTVHPATDACCETAGSCCTVNVNLSGHANANHEPTPGWSNDCVTVSVSSAQVPAATP